MSTSPAPRARPRLACQECRRRKLRCDGAQPRCSTCENTGTECDVNTNRPPRGPKKGYLKALQSKIDTLESRLEAQENVLPKWPEGLDGGGTDISSSITALPCVTLPGYENARLDVNPFTISGSLVLEQDSFLGAFVDAASGVPTGGGFLPDHTPPTPLTAGSSQSGIHVTDLMQAELDQLYFDRIHAAVPILHQRRYLSWSKSPLKTSSRIYLQYAMWAAASLMSAHFQHLQDMLYTEVKRMLTRASLPCSGGQNTLPVDVELVQAWVLTATYEFVKSNRHEACISAGRALRLAQLMGFYRIDGPNSGPSASETDFIITEEKRRAFWMAFTLESLYCMRNNLPLVINEHNITTFLPVPDAEFQNGQQVQTGFLSDCIDKRSLVVKSPLNECIMLIATCARTLVHVQQHSTHLVYTRAECDHLDLQNWLDNVLSVRLQTLAQDYPSATNSSDPTLLFANCLAQASIIYLCREIHAIDWPSGGGRGIRWMTEYQQRALNAVERSLDLARSLTDFPLFKISPFMPIPLFLCAEFLSLNRSNPATAPLLQNLLDTLGQLKEVDSPQQSYIGLSDLDQVVTDMLEL